MPGTCKHRCYRLVADAITLLLSVYVLGISNYSVMAVSYSGPVSSISNSKIVLAAKVTDDNKPGLPAPMLQRAGRRVELTYNSGDPDRVYWGITEAALSMDGSDFQADEILHNGTVNLSSPAANKKILTMQGTTRILWVWDGRNWNYRPAYSVRFWAEFTNLDDRVTDPVNVVRGSSVGMPAPYVLEIKKGKPYKVRLRFDAFRGGVPGATYYEPNWAGAMDVYDFLQTSVDKGAWSYAKMGFFYNLVPENLKWSDGTVVANLRENQTSAVKVADLAGIDDGPEGDLTYTLVSYKDSKGNTFKPNVQFYIQNRRQLWVKNPQSLSGGKFLDRETEGQWSFTVKVDDGLNNSTFSNLALNLTDDPEPPIVNTPFPDKVVNEEFTPGIDLSQFASYFSDPENNITGYTIRVTPADMFNYNPTDLMSRTGISGTTIVNLYSKLDLFGEATVTVTATDATGLSTSAPFKVKVNNINDPPVFNGQNAFMRFQEDGAEQSFDLNSIFKDVDLESLTYTYEGSVWGSNTNSTSNVFAAPGAARAPVISGSTLRLQPMPDQNDLGGTVFVKIRAADKVSSVMGVLRVNVTNVNDRPLFTATQFAQVLEDSGNQSIANFFPVLKAGPDDESGQQITPTVTAVANATSNPNLLTGLPVIVPQADGTGKLVFTPAENQYGTNTYQFSLKDNGGTERGGADTSLSGTFAIRVGAVNDPPQFSMSGTNSSGTKLTLLNGDVLFVPEQPDQNLVSRPIYINLSNVNGGPNEPDDQVTVSASILSNTVPNLAQSVIAEKIDNSNWRVAVTLSNYKNGKTFIAITANDGVGGITTKNISLVVENVDHYPVPGSNFPSTTTILEDQVFSLNLADAFVSMDGESFDSVTVSTTSPDLSAEVRNVTTSNGAVQGSLVLTPSANKFTFSTFSTNNPIPITLFGSARGLSTNRTLFVHIREQNDPPTINSLTNVIIFDTGIQRILLKGISPGPFESDFDSVASFDLSSSDQSLISNSGMAIENYNARLGQAVLRITPPASGQGNALVTLGMTDQRGARSTHLFNVQVNHVNHAPKLANPLPEPFKSAPITGRVRPTLYILEDSGINSVPVAGLLEDVDGDVINYSIFGNTNAALVRASFENVLGPLHMEPSADQFGRSEILIQGNDGILEAFFTFAVEVVPVNDPPRFDPLIRQRIKQESTPADIRITGIKTGPSNEGSQKIKLITAEVIQEDQPGLINSLNIVYDYANTVETNGLVNNSPTATLQYRLGRGKSGLAKVKVTVQDDGGIANGGIDFLSREFSVQVDAISHEPTVTNPIGEITVKEDQFVDTGNRTTIDLGKVFSNPDNPLIPVDILYSETLDPGDVLDNEAIGGIRVPSASPQSLQVTFKPNAFGTAEVRFKGLANNLVSSTFDTLRINVQPINDAPTADPVADQLIVEGAGPQRLTVRNVRPGPANESSQTITNIVAEVISSNPGNLLIIEGVDYTPQTASFAINYRSTPFLSGTAKVRVTMTDDGGTEGNDVNTSQFTFNVTVQGISHAPVLAKPLPVLEFFEDQFESDNFFTTINLKGYFRDVDGYPLQLVLKGVDDPDDVIEDLGGSVSVLPADPETLRVRFKPFAFGVATIRLGAFSQGLNSTTDGALSIAVTPVNDAPTFDPIPNLTLEHGTTNVIVKVTGLDPGPRETATQKIVNVYSEVVSETRPGLIAGTPVVRFVPGQTTADVVLSAGTHMEGVAVVRVSAEDNGSRLDDGEDTFSREFIVTVVDSDDAPVVQIPETNFVLQEAEVLTNNVRSLNLAGVFKDDADASITLLLSSIVDPDSILVTSTISTSPQNGEVLNFTFRTNVFGTATIYLKAAANRLVSTDIHALKIRILPTDDVPTLDPILRQTVSVNSGTHSLTLTGIGAGIGEEGGLVTVNASIRSEEPVGLIKDLRVEHNGTNSTAQLYYTVSPDLEGLVSIRVRVSDGGGHSFFRDFRVKVISGDDPPYVLNPEVTITVLEDQFASTKNLGSLTALAFDDLEGDRVDFIVESNGISDPSDILADETNPPRYDPNKAQSLLVTFNPSVSGTATLKVRGTANGLISTGLVNLTIQVLPVNDPPVVAAIENITIQENSGPLTVPFAIQSVGPADEASQKLISVAAFVTSGGNPVFNSNIDVDFDPATGRGTMRLVPLQHAAGLVQITLVVKDDGGVANGGQDTTLATFVVNVVNVDQAPELIAGNENIILNYSPAELTQSGNRITLDLSNAFVDPDGDPIRAVVITRFNPDGLINDSTSGSVVNDPANPLKLNVLLRTNTFGFAELTVKGFANGRYTTEFSRIRIEVTPPLGAPSFDPIADVGIVAGPSNRRVTIQGIRPGTLLSGALQVTDMAIELVSMSQPDFLSLPILTYTSGSTEAVIDIVPNGLISGTAVFRVTARDNGVTTATRTNQFSREFTLNVVPAVSVPVATSPNQDLTYREDQFANSGRQVSAKLTGLFKAGTNPVRLLILTTGYSDPSNILDEENSRVYVDPLDNEAIVLGFNPDASGIATILVSATSKGLQSSDVVTLKVNVLPVNDAPKINAIDPVKITKYVDPVVIPITGLSVGPVSESAQTILGITPQILQQTPGDFIQAVVVDYSTGANGQVKITPKLGVPVGSARIRLTVQDNGGIENNGQDNAAIEFDFTASIRPDPPQLVRPIGKLELLEDSLASSNNKTEVDLTGSFAAPPGSALSLTITSISDASDILNDERTDGVTLVQRDGKWILGVTARPNAFGTATISYRAVAGGVSSTQVDSLTVSLLPVNDSPTFVAPGEVRFAQGPVQTKIRLTSISAGPREGNQSITNMTLTVLEQTPSDLIQGSAFTVPVSASSMDMVVPLNPARAGTAKVRISMQDDGGTSNGGSNSSSRDVTIVVTPVDHPPELISPIGQTNLTVAAVKALDNNRLLFPLEGRFKDIENDPISYFILAVQDPRNLLADENQGVTIVTNSFERYLSITFRTDVTGSATIEYLAFANGQISPSTDILTITVSSEAEVSGKLVAQSLPVGSSEDVSIIKSALASRIDWKLSSINFSRQGKVSANSLDFTQRQSPIVLSGMHRVDRQNPYTGQTELGVLEAQYIVFSNGYPISGSAWVSGDLYNWRSPDPEVLAVLENPFCAITDLQIQNTRQFLFWKFETSLK